MKDRPMKNHSVIVSLIDDVILARKGPDEITLKCPINLQRPHLTLKQVSSGLLSALEQMQDRGISIPFQIAKIMQTDGVGGITKLKHYLDKLGEHAMLKYHLIVEDVPFASLLPLTTYFKYEENRVKKDTAYGMSRFAYCHNDQGGMVLNSPLSYSKVLLQQSGALTALYRLIKPCTPGQLAETVGELDEDSALAFMNILINSGAIQKIVPREDTVEISDPALGQWAFHDLLFHAGNRMGRHGDPYGGTFHLIDKFEHLPSIKPPMSDEIIPLHRPDVEALNINEASFSRVLETRQTIREYGDVPIHVDQLGEFLYRSARIKKLINEAEVSWRPSPGGGAIHELEIYPMVNQCRGLEFGLYHYNPMEHYLSRVTTAHEPAVRWMLEVSRITGRLEQPPHILFILAARFQRLQIKYQSVAYSVILKNVGCLYQTMYLVATAMGLAPCALGGGDSDLFARTAGLDYYAETSVGEILLGSGPSVRPEPLQPPKEVI